MATAAIVLVKIFSQRNRAAPHASKVVAVLLDKVWMTEMSVFQPCRVHACTRDSHLWLVTKKYERVIDISSYGMYIIKYSVRSESNIKTV